MKNKQFTQSTNEQMDVKMRILANCLIDRVLELQQEAIKKGLNINLERDRLIIEQSVEPD